MNLEEEVIRIGKQLEKLVSQDMMDPEKGVDLLKNLKDLPITLEVLQKTRIGMSVNVLRKKSENSNVQTVAKSLIKSWKKLLPASSSDKETKDKQKDKVSDKESKSDLNGKTPSESSTSSRSSSPSLNSKCEPTTPKDNKVLSFPASKPSANAIREKCREMMVNSLQTDDSEIKSAIGPEEIAAMCEEFIFQEFKDTNMKYKSRIRSRVSNLRDTKNPEFKKRVLLGEITPQRLASMPTEEMASEEMKKIRQNMTKESIRDAQMSKNTGTETALFKCGKCGKRKTTYNQLQTRSADEPMTTFVLCLECGNRWKFC